jgi:hypothetical protein
MDAQTQDEQAALQSPVVTINVGGGRGGERGGATGPANAAGVAPGGRGRGAVAHDGLASPEREHPRGDAEVQRVERAGAFAVAREFFLRHLQ